MWVQGSSDSLVCGSVENSATATVPGGHNKAWARPDPDPPTKPERSTGDDGGHTGGAPIKTFLNPRLWEARESIERTKFMVLTAQEQTESRARICGVDILRCPKNKSNA
ncbi:hypothetical protein NDU88_001675 [Pleurodeles waltl]|uniref:Uncharacterized protein n=1 Tax=Pleurodeles waltl TaxID=8319 RepID=A0AAV7U7I8_PLEWA|nr:hypothetical protein NDU88_001675 [Pleurodeles waltl]